MRTLNRNKRKFYYAQYEGKLPIKDEWGNETGESETKYSSLILLRANISPARGETDVDLFGVSLDYDRVIVLGGFNPLSETSILWIDASPSIKSDGTTETPHDYRVVRIGESLNGTAIAVKRVSVSK